METTSLFALSISSVILFCVCCFYLTKNILTPVSRIKNPEYSFMALKIRKSYKVFSFTVLSLFFLVTLIHSFLEIFSV